MDLLVPDSAPEQVRLCWPGQAGTGGREKVANVTKVGWGAFWRGEGSPGGRSGPGCAMSHSSAVQILSPNPNLNSITLTAWMRVHDLPGAEPSSPMNDVQHGGSGMQSFLLQVVPQPHPTLRWVQCQPVQLAWLFQRRLFPARSYLFFRHFYSAFLPRSSWSCPLVPSFLMSSQPLRNMQSLEQHTQAGCAQWSAGGFVEPIPA